MTQADISLPQAQDVVVVAISGCPPPEVSWRTRDARVLGVDSELAEDAVTGRRISKAQAIKREYKGAIYYFETPENAEVFDRNPTLYAVVENVPPGDAADVK